MFRNPRHDEQAPPYAIDDGRQSGKNIEQRIYVFSDAAVSGSDILAWLDGPCTRLAIDAWITLVLQLVIRNMMLLYILLHILFAPVDERVHLNQVMNVVSFHYLHILAGYALLLSQSADPYIQSLHRPLQRFQFSYLAAAVSAFYRIIEEVDALFLHHLLHRLIVWEEHFQVDAIRHVGLVDELVGLREESACIECEDAGRFICLHGALRARWQYSYLIARTDDAAAYSARITAVVRELAADRTNHILYRETEEIAHRLMTYRNGLQIVQQSRSLIPRSLIALVHHVVAILGADRDKYRGSC